MKSFTLTLAAMLATQTMAAEDGKCYALVLSGGGNNGAWEAGVLWGLYNYGNPIDYEYDMVVGISAGSINTIGMVGFDPKDGVNNA